MRVSSPRNKRLASYLCAQSWLRYICVLYTYYINILTCLSDQVHCMYMCGLSPGGREKHMKDHLDTTSFQINPTNLDRKLSDPRDIFQWACWTDPGCSRKCAYVPSVFFLTEVARSRKSDTGKSYSKQSVSKCNTLCRLGIYCITNLVILTINTI